jgi:hypothetical protein
MPWFIDVTAAILAYERCASLAVGNEGPGAIGGTVDALLTKQVGFLRPEFTKSLDFAAQAIAPSAQGIGDRPV